LSIQDWGAVGEILGAIGIVVTLVYLAQQIRYARLASMDATRQNRVSAIREIQYQLVSDPKAGAVWAKLTAASMGPANDALAKAYDLTDEEARIAFQIAANWMWTHWAQYHSLKSRADEEELERLVQSFYTAAPMDLMITLPFVRAHFDPGFWSWLDATLAKAPSQPG
jgi:hypothetical protein